jgi:8-oxo-dGTP diphosphatase
VRARLHTRALLGWLLAIEAAAQTGVALTACRADRRRFGQILDLARELSGTEAGPRPPRVDALAAIGHLDDAAVAARYVTPKLRASVVTVLDGEPARVVLADRGPGRPLGLVGDFVDLDEFPADTALRAGREHGVEVDPDGLRVIGVLDRLRSATGSYGPSYDVVFAARGTPTGGRIRSVAADGPAGLDGSGPRLGAPGAPGSPGSPGWQDSARPVRPGWPDWAESPGSPGRSSWSGWTVAAADSDVARVTPTALAAVRGEPTAVVLDGPRPDRIPSRRPATTGPAEPPPRDDRIDRLATLAAEGHRARTSIYDHARYHEISTAVRGLRRGIPFVPDGGAPVWMDDRLATARAITPTLCVSVAVLDRFGRLLLMRRAMSGQWDFVSGYADPGDPPAGVAVKEAAEELGLTVEVTGLLGVVDGVRASEGIDGPITTVALTAHVVAGLLRVDPVEATDVAWFRRDRLPWPLSGCVRTLAGLAFDRRGATPRPAFFDEPRIHRGERPLRRTAWRINGSSSGTSTAR